MKPLNFPKFEFKLELQGQKKLIFDIIRKKFIPLSPEEWVRQHVIHTCIENYKLPLGLVAVEKEFKFNNKKRRFDVAVLENTGKTLLLVECKAPEVAINANTWFQSTVYQQHLNAKYIWLTNGLEHYWLEFTGQEYVSIPMPSAITNS